MRNVFTGIDIGTHHVRVVITDATRQGDAPPRIIGIGSAASRGLRHGYIMNHTDVSHAIAEAVATAAKGARTRIESARLAIGGVGLDEIQAEGETTLTRSGGEVTEDDIERVLRSSERKAMQDLLNRKILHTIPLSFYLDGHKIIGRPIGMRGTKLTGKTLLITTLEQHYNDLIEAVESAGIEVEEVIAAPLAASLVNLARRQKIAGVTLANIGAETTSIAIFEDDVPISVKVFPVGSADITNDLALAFKVTLPEAEQLKRGTVLNSPISPKKIDDTINSRLKELFGHIDEHLKKMGRKQLLPAGIVITGGGAELTNAPDVARATLKLPSQAAQLPTQTRNIGIDTSWSVAYGLCVWGFSVEHEGRRPGSTQVFKSLWRHIVSGLQGLLP
jgi:cell division protein FtsA